MQLASTRALASGALVPLVTRGTTLEDEGVVFAVRILENLARKQAASPVPGALTPRSNPFLPYDENLFIADVSPTHVALLNKFNVVDHHVLIVTRSFEPQESWLTPHDFEAWLTCLDEYPSLGFYNSGSVAGASQPHKHLQLVPLPLGPDGPAFPMAERWQAATPVAGVWHSAPLPFAHALVRLPDAAAASARARAAQLAMLYRGLLAFLDLGGSADSQPRPHNLLITRDWLFTVPRRQECFASISLNAMAFAGGLLVRDEAQLDRLRMAGPFTALRTVVAGEQAG